MHKLLQTQPIGPRWQVSLAASVAVLLILFMPASGLNAAPLAQDATGPERCALCHSAEFQEWQVSPHAQAMTPIDEAADLGCEEAAGEDCTCLSCHSTSFEPGAVAEGTTGAHSGVTCEACHGAYVKDHPANGVMQLDVDSSVCSDCHVETHEDWEQTAHAEAGVQCIGCHRSHSQNLRLDDEVLCSSCHRDRLEDSGHVAHNRVGIACIDCHTEPEHVLVSATSMMGGSPEPSHDFSVSTEACAQCHGPTFHGEESTMSGEGVAMARQPAASEEARAAAAQEVAAQESQRWLQGATAISFGLGIGVGGMVGIVMVLILGIVCQRGWRGRA